MAKRKNDAGDPEPKPKRTSTAKRRRQGARPSEPDRDMVAQILDAAHTVFLRTGTAGARMVDIARAAGVNHALLHYYFDSKDRLAEEVFRRAVGSFLPGVLASLGSDAPLESKVAEVVSRYTELLKGQPYLAGYVLAELTYRPERATQLFRTAANGGFDTLRSRVMTVLDAQIRARVRAGTMRRISAEQFFVNVLALTVFPFVARPLLHAVLGLDAAAFDAFAEARRREVPALVFGGLLPVDER